ncbi:hypothetical protein N7448_009843 [Penicillium atrosanguineum]|nr:hypothetical protein N7448_009843 [Penicillium atrosanguineum]
MTFRASDPPRRRRLHRWVGGKPSTANDVQVQKPLYMTTEAAFSVHGIQRVPQNPPVPYGQPQNAATASILQLPPRHTPVAPPATHPYVARGSPYQTVHHSTQKPWASYTNLTQSVSSFVSHTTGKANATILDLENLVLRSLRGGLNVHEATAELFNQVITLTDTGLLCGKENELRTLLHHGPFGKEKPSASLDYFSKVYLYENSRLSPHLQALKFYPATYPLLRLAAQYSRRVYDKPSGQERHSYVSSDWRQGTKAMVIKSLPIDDMNTIVFAIRGTQSFLDWAVNVNAAPVSPSGFLDDPANCCHAGFLSVARKMISPVAARLRALIEEDPSRMSYTLLITGHSAGGSVASLLYLHLLSKSPQVKSELTHLRGCFKHIHCVTFGAPPVSFRPLGAPVLSKRSKSIFFAFINEGDPVTRADKGYFLSLLDLYASPAPGSAWSVLDPRKKSRPAHYWQVPPCTLSNAGRLVLLCPRGQRNGRSDVRKPILGDPAPLPPSEEIEACGTTDTEIRGVVFGDPLMHLMDLYSRRIEALAQDSEKRR